MLRTYTAHEVSDAVVEAFRSLDPKLVLLFGSLARDSWDSDSDVDVLVVYETSKRFLDRLEELYLRWSLPISIDILAYTPDEFRDLLEWNSFVQDVVAEGKMIYEAIGT